jgi:hypothetical protein
VTIDRYVQAIADANGTATARVPGPTNAGQTWELLSMQVASTSTARTEARVYADAVSPTNLRGQSRDGRLDSATGEGETVRAGAVLIVQWIGADVGAVCTATALFREA